MSYGAALALHDAVFARLRDDPNLAERIGGDIYDSVPPGSLPALYIAVGPEKVRDASDFLESGAEHDFSIAIIGNGVGFRAIKEAAADVNDALLRETLTLARGSLISLRFLKAEARRESDEALRQIDLTFRARIDATQMQ